MVVLVTCLERKEIIKIVGEKTFDINLGNKEKK